MISSNLRNSVCLVVFASAVAAQAQYVQTNLVSDGFVPARHVDSNLVNPWGLAFSGSGPWWVADNGKAVSTVYDGSGNPFPAVNPLVVNVRPLGTSAPTGLVANTETDPDFTITKSGTTKPSVFIFATEDGRIEGWNPQVDFNNTVVAVTTPNAVYKGATMLNDRLFVTNFHSGFVEVYNENFDKIDQFKDSSLPAGYAPFGIQNIGGVLYVTFALQNSEKHDDVAGAGNGYVDKFTSGGVLIARFATRGVLNSPWGIAKAPSGFGPASGDILIGNFGDGKINVFTPQGAFVKAMFDNHGKVIVNPGLWSIKFGNGGNAGSTHSLFFTAGLNHEADGLFGRIDLPVG